MSGVDQQRLIQELVNLSLDLGRTPNRDEFIKVVAGSKRSIMKHFGSYAAFVQAAGLDPVAVNRHTNKIFEKNISSVLANRKPEESPLNIKYKPSLFVGDTHFPFASKRVLEEIYRFAEKHQPVRIVQVGDLTDMYAHSKFPRSHNIYNPKEEEELAIAGAAEMWSTLRSLCPQAECIQLLGNHDIRPIRRTLESLPALEHVVEKHLISIMQFEGVRLISDPREELFFDDVQVIHGYLGKLGAHRDYMLMNTIHGHTHKLGILYRKLQDRIIWEMDCGFVGDPESKVFSYTPQKTTNEMQGFGWLDEYGPRTIIV